MKKPYAWLAQTLVFWLVLLPVLNTDYLLLWLAWLNPAGLVEWLWMLLETFYRFLVPVLALTGLLAWRAMRAMQRRLGTKPYWPLAANACCFVILLFVGELFKNAIIVTEAWRADADCLHIHSMLHSIMAAGEHAPSHAFMIDDGQLYFWSFRELAFVASPPREYYDCRAAAM